MAKVVFGEYAAFKTNGGVRYQKHNKLVSESAIPVEVVNYLKKQLHIQPDFPKPSPEETERLKEESQRVPAGLERSDEEMEAQRQAYEAQAEEALTPEGVLTPDDFPVEDLPPEGTGFPPDLGIVGEEIAAEEAVDEMSDFMEQVSIHTASLDDIAEALYNRFGIYTVYLGKLPVASEVNPLTGEMFTKYHQGIAYQAAIRAKTQGILKRNPEMGRQRIDETKRAHENFRDQFAPAPYEETFAYRTSSDGNRPVPTTEIVHEVGSDGRVRAVQRDIPPERRNSSPNGARSVRHPEEEEPLVQPKIGGAPIIRPDW